MCNILENVSEQFNDNGSLLPTNPRPRYLGHKVIINLQILNRDRYNPGILINRPLYPSPLRRSIKLLLVPLLLPRSRNIVTMGHVTLSRRSRDMTRWFVTMAADSGNGIWVAPGPIYFINDPRNCDTGHGCDINNEKVRQNNERVSQISQTGEKLETHSICKNVCLN